MGVPVHPAGRLQYELHHVWLGVQVPNGQLSDAAIEIGGCRMDEWCRLLIAIAAVLLFLWAWTRRKH